VANPITARQISKLVQNLENSRIGREDFQAGIIERPLEFAQFIVDAVNPHKATRLPKESGELTFPSLTQQAAALMEAIPGLQATWPETTEEAELPDGADGLALLPRPSALLHARYNDLPPADSSNAEGIGVRLGDSPNMLREAMRRPPHVTTGTSPCSCGNPTTGWVSDCQHQEGSRNHGTAVSSSPSHWESGDRSATP